MENRYKFHKNSWKLLKEHLNEAAAEVATPTGVDFSTLFFNIARMVNNVAVRLVNADKKLPPREPGKTFLQSEELVNIANSFEKMSKYCHTNKCDRLTIAKMFGKLVERLGNYFNVISEYGVGLTPNLDDAITELAMAVQKIRKAYRKV